MIFNSITLQNFKSHKDTSIQFKQGTTLILGENGAGKSSILEAINYALFKDYTGKAEDLIKRNERMMKVELMFTTHNQVYIVCRTRQSSKSTAELYIQKDNGEKVTVATGDTVVNSTLKEILCMDSSTFSNAIHIKQGEITSLISESPSERKKAIGKLMKIDNLEKAYTHMKTVINEYSNRIRVLDEILQDTDELKLKLGKLEDDETTTQKRITELEEKITNDEIVLDNERNKLKSLDNDKEKHIRYTEQINMENNIIKQINDDKKRLQDDINTITSESQDTLQKLKDKLRNQSIPYDDNTDVMIASIKRNTMKLQDKHDKLSSKIDDYDAKIMLLEHEIIDNKDSLNSLIDVEGICPVCKSSVSEEQKHNMIRDYEDRISKKTIQKEELLIKRENAEHENSGLFTEIIGLEDLANEIHEYDASAKSDITEAEDKIETKIKEMKEHENTIEELKLKLGNLSYDKDACTVIEKHIIILENDNKKDIMELSMMKNELEHIRNDIIMTEESIIINEEHHKEKSNLESYIGLMEKMRACYSKDELQKELRSKIVPLIEKYSNHFFSLFDFEYDKMMIDDDYSISILDNGNVMSLNMMSGGEKIAIALALRMGITQSLSEQDIETIMLDEPTIHLDDYRRQELTDVLKGNSMIPQMIIVTHDEELMHMADHIINIKKEDGLSYVE